MAIERGGRFGNGRKRVATASSPAWPQPLPSGPVTSDPTLRTARQPLEQPDVRVCPGVTPAGTTGVPRRAA